MLFVVCCLLFGIVWCCLVSLFVSIGICCCCCLQCVVCLLLSVAGCCCSLFVVL